jgi:TolA-binding protein
MLALLICAAFTAQMPPSGQEVTRALAGQPGRDGSLLHRGAARGVDSLDREQEQALRRLLDQGGPSGEQAEVLARLAATLRGRGLERGIAAQVAQDEGRQAAAQAARASAAQARAEAIARYRELLHRFPAWPRQDEALFFLADTLQDSGDDDEAVKVAAELVRRFPRSPWAPDSHVFLGEHLFEKAKLAEALREYRAAAEVKTAEVYPYALYKAAWCRFNQGAFTDAMKLLHEVVQVSLGRAARATAAPTPGAVAAASKVQLAREARRDFVTVYARAGRPEAARDEFARLFGRDDGLHMLELYGRLLFDTGRDAEAQGVSRQLLELHDHGPGAALDQTRLLLLAARTGKKREFIREARALVEVFRSVRAHEVGEVEQEAIAEAERLAEEELRQLAVRAHNEAKKTGLDETFAAAKELYADYLALFPKAEHAYELRFFNAELLYGLGEKPEAAALYEEVARLDLAAQRAKAKAGRWQERAAWGAVLARDESAREQAAPPGRQQKAAAKATQGSSPGGGAVQRPLSAREEQLAFACALYLEALPDGPHAVEVAFKLGRLRYLSGALDEAREKLAWVATQHPENELAEYAANLVLDIENLRHDSKAVNAWAAKFLADRKLTAHGKLAQDLTRVEEQSAYALADAAASDGAKARALIEFANSHPRGALVDKALFGAAAALSRASEIDAALETRARIWKEFPQSELVPRALLASADDRARVGDFAESAALLERYAAGYLRRAAAVRQPPAGARGRPDAPRPAFDESSAKTALHDAALLREARGELRLALQDREAELSQWRHASDRDETALAAAQLFAQLGMNAQAARRLSALARGAQGPPAVALVAWREAARNFAKAKESGNVAWASGELEKTWRAMGPKAREKAGEEGAAAAAEAHLALGARLFEEYRRQRIEPPLLRTLARKVALLQQVKKRAEEVVGMRQAAPAVCALSQLGEAQALLAWGIAQSPAPSGLTVDERKLYRAQLDEKAQPLFAEARETLRGARDRAVELGVAGSCVAKAQAQLEKLGEPATPRRALPEMALAMAQVPALLDPDGQPVPHAGQAGGRSKDNQVKGSAAPAAAPAAGTQIDEQGAGMSEGHLGR